MDPQTYFAEFVQPNYSDFLAHRDSLRHAANAAVSAYHLVDYVAKQEGLTGSGKVVEQFRSKCPEFTLIQQIANTFKHAVRDPSRSKKEVTVVTDVLRIKVGQQEPFSDGTFFSDGTGLESERSRIVIDGEDGRPHDFEFNIGKVMEHLRLRFGS
ncbi:hypothetical protein [Geminicoccus roseus]|uniref:hypothetical protein n=1 Tax=Geminicoccus roseus TaxID=404900 RepID=UPI000480BCEA|nr:hypothetical protein [Geminicoccus roseus]